MRLNEVLEIKEVDKIKVVQCNRCARVLCRTGQDWRKHSATSEKPLHQAGPLSPLNSPFILREFYCPGCGTMLDVEVVLKGEELPPDTVKASQSSRSHGG